MKKGRKIICKRCRSEKIKQKNINVQIKNLDIKKRGIKDGILKHKNEETKCSSKEGRNKKIKQKKEECERK